jgi:hypothetical protein
MAHAQAAVSFHVLASSLRGLYIVLTEAEYRPIPMREFHLSGHQGGWARIRDANHNVTWAAVLDAAPDTDLSMTEIISFVLKKLLTFNRGNM